ncbi:MAG: phosphatidylglycerophosphatase A family protein [Desulfobacca sp.]|uniref:phosphatidylglycerophosphatase A family protein n=1 Tax=Desulfobacca sp. TaxID=2067990 RepID=UPI004049BC4F
MSWSARGNKIAATWFGVGRLPIIPGTWGSLAALPLWWLINALNGLVYSGIIVGLLALAIHCCGQAEIAIGRHDAPEIVLDEVVGQLIALAGCSGSLGQILAGVFLFRSFDILKPWPLSWVNDRMTGGLGIVLDDALAGLLAGLVLMVLSRWLPL